MDTVKVSLKLAQAEMKLKEGQPVEVERLRQLVVDAGFTPTWIRFEAIGRLTTRDGTSFFKVEGTDQLIALVADEQLEALRKATGQDGKRVAIVGMIPQEKNRAQVERFEVP
ncbi:MAG: hypothetical protein C3F12_08375 [Candidatus Methylomirabilota bacterium]|nr:MAG: hypothetical protein C3F12_08375 [candidate division NC10 bacterium]